MTITQVISWLLEQTETASDPHDRRVLGISAMTVSLAVQNLDRQTRAEWDASIKEMNFTPQAVKSFLKTFLDFLTDTMTRLPYLQQAARVAAEKGLVQGDDLPTKSGNEFVSALMAWVVTVIAEAMALIQNRGSDEREGGGD